MRLEKLGGFWEKITADPLWSLAFSGGEMCDFAYKPRGDLARALANQFSAGLAMALGAPGFSPRARPLVSTCRNS